MIFSGILSVFTGIAINLSSVVVYDQGLSNSCSAYAITTCESYIGKSYSTGQVYSDLVRLGGLATDGGIYTETISNYLGGYISLSGVIESLNKGIPVIASLQGFSYYKDGQHRMVRNGKKRYMVYKGTEMVFKGEPGGHSVCVVGYNKEGLVFQNSHGVKFGYNGFAIVRWQDIKDTQFISL